VAALGLDTHGLKPTMLVGPGDRVALGQPLFEDKKNPGVRTTSPGAGRVIELHRGERRALISVVIELDEASDDRVRFASYTGKPVDTLNDAEVRALLIEAGLWDSFRMRPFGRVAAWRR
jgi:Na+-transporting NADH:ubiquinone oxidoreductase subunit A